MSNVLAYFLTWTTYGSWLHGNRRGSVDRSNTLHGMDYHAPNPEWESESKRRMKAPAVVLSPQERTLVEEVIQKHCRIRDWRLIAANCRSNHVHIIVSTDGAAPERVMTELKAYATRALRKNSLHRGGRVWTRGGSTRYIESESALDSAVQYVKHQ